MPQLTYSVEDAFGAALPDHGASAYLIAPYQRGYKWTSDPANPPDQVGKLLDDLWRAAEEPSPSEYYLQFLTLQPARHNTDAVLEVIDGQQRLTTLTLFFAVLRHILQAESASTDFDFIDHDHVRNRQPRLRYALLGRERFLDDFVYDRAGLAVVLQHPNWEDFQAAVPDFLRRKSVESYDCDQQDIYYLHRAAHAMRAFLEQYPPDRQLTFGRYVARHARLLFNVVGEELVSESVFSDLNSNRVVLTDAELVKGLLLTRAARPAGADVPASELHERRAAYGRAWDETARWLQEAPVREVLGLGKPEEAFGRVLQLVAERLKGPASSKIEQTEALKQRRDALSKAAPGAFPLFEFFSYAIQLDPAAAGAALADLRLLVGLLRDWVEDSLTRNLLGALQMSKAYNLKANLLTTLTERDELEKGKPVNWLKSQLATLPCLQAELTDLTFEDYKADTFDLLLLLNVFPPGQQATDHRFDFVRFRQENWSLEHIYPQNPDGRKELTTAYLTALRGVLNDADENDVKLSALLNTESPENLSEDDQQTLRDARPRCLHGIGNLALLDGGTNSAFSNHGFAAKRRILVERVQKGIFVPPHTYGVFSKLLTASSSPANAQTDAGLTSWSSQDATNHQRYLETARQQLIEFLSVSSTPQ